MIFGYSTNAFVKSDLFGALDRISDLGFRGVEIMCDRPHLYPPDFDPEKRSALKSTLIEKGLKTTNLNSFTLFAVGDTYLPSWIEPEPERREIRIRHTLDCLEIAAYLGCSNISVPPGGPLPGGMSRKKAEDLFRRGLARVIPTAEALGVKILVEPEPDLLMENTREVKPFVQAVNAECVGINFDIGHFYCAGEDPSEAFETLFPWIGHVHIEDIAPSRRHNHLIPGLGAIAFRRIFETMKRLDYAHHMTLELYPYVDMPETAGRDGLSHLLPLLKEAGWCIEDA